MIAALETAGPVLMYTSYERTVIQGLADDVPGPGQLPCRPSMPAWSTCIPVALRVNYYHPDMLGSWSIKAVLPTIAPDMDYSLLEGIQEGTGSFTPPIWKPSTPKRARNAGRKFAATC